MTEFVDWQFVSTVSIIASIIGSAVLVTHWITRKITRLEDRIEGLEKNPLLEAFRESQKDHATRLTKLDENFKNWEDHKVSKPEGEEKEGEQRGR